MSRRRVGFDLVSVLLIATSALAAVPVPTLRGPITPAGGAFIAPPGSVDLAGSGYLEEEYFMSGTARAYVASGPLRDDGKWTAARNGESADYVTRILVRRPSTPSKFNGTVIVE